jgi:hypothetical protein
MQIGGVNDCKCSRDQRLCVPLEAQELEIIHFWLSIHEEPVSALERAIAEVKQRWSVTDVQVSD